MTDYETYVKRYAASRQISIAEAETHEMVKAVKAFYGGDEDDKS